MAQQTQQQEIQDTIEEHQIVGHDNIKEILSVGVDNNYPCLIIGDTGTGKTSIVREMAMEKGKHWTRYNLTGETTVDDFVGKYTLQGDKTVWEDGILLQAMKNGHWLIVDELNAALQEIHFVLHSLLDDDKSVTVAQKDGEVVRPHEDFRLFATMNPVDEYAGTKDLNKSFKSRFNIVINMGYPERKDEIEIVRQKGAVDDESALTIVDVGRTIRQAKDEDDIYYTCSTRDLIQWASLVERLGIDQSFILSVLNKANGDGDKLQEIYNNVTKRYLDLAKDGHEISLEYFENEARRIDNKRKNLARKHNKIRDEIRQEILQKLQDGSNLQEDENAVTEESV